MASQKIALLLVCRVYVSDFPLRNLPAYKKCTLTQTFANVDICNDLNRSIQLFNSCGWDYSSLIYQARDRDYIPKNLHEESQKIVEKATPLKAMG